MSQYRRFYIGFVIVSYSLSPCILSSCSQHSFRRTIPSPGKENALGKKNALGKADVSIPQLRHGASMGHAEDRKATEEPAPRPTRVGMSAVPSVWKGVAVRQVATREKVFALTFDDGPHPVYTRKVLEILRANDIRATFFMVGEMVKSYPATARQVRDSGHAVGNHTWTHPSKPRNARREVERTDAVIRQTWGNSPSLFRPPYGLMKNGLSQVAQTEGETVVLWSAAGADWSHKATAGGIASQIIKEAAPGGIALLHDGGGNRSTTVAALPRIIRELRARGYHFVTVPELLTLSTPAITSRPSEAQQHRHNSKSRPGRGAPLP